MEQWRNMQEKKFRDMVADMAYEITKKTGEPPAYGWLRWAMDYICRRFQYLEKNQDWIKTLASIDDDILLFSQNHEKAVKYLKMIRDYARRYNTQ